MLIGCAVNATGAVFSGTSPPASLPSTQSWISGDCAHPRGGSFRPHEVPPDRAGIVSLYSSCFGLV